MVLGQLAALDDDLDMIQQQLDHQMGAQDQNKDDARYMQATCWRLPGKCMYCQLDAGTSSIMHSARCEHNVSVLGTVYSLVLCHHSAEAPYGLHCCVNALLCDLHCCVHVWVGAASVAVTMSAQHQSGFSSHSNNIRLVLVFCFGTCHGRSGGRTLSTS